MIFKGEELSLSFSFLFFDLLLILEGPFLWPVLIYYVYRCRVAFIILIIIPISILVSLFMFRFTS